MASKNEFATKNGFSVASGELYNLDRVESSVVDVVTKLRLTSGSVITDLDEVAVKTSATTTESTVHHSDGYLIRIPAAAGTEDVVAAETLENGTNGLTLVGGVGQLLDVPRALQITVTDANAGITAGGVRISGRTFGYGLFSTLVEEIDISAGAGTYTTTEAYVSLSLGIITFDVAGAGVGDTIAVGYANKFGLPTAWQLTDTPHIESAYLLKSSKITGGTRTDETATSTITAATTNGSILYTPNTAADGATDFEVFYQLQVKYEDTEHQHDTLD